MREHVEQIGSPLGRTPVRVEHTPGALCHERAYAVLRFRRIRARRFHLCGNARRLLQAAR